jgi:hypothetical protein
MRRERSSGTIRRKSKTRCMARDLRVTLPFVGFFCCYSMSATAIVMTERIALESRAALESHSFTISSSSTSKASAAPGGMRPAPRLP